jgi:hypothetical protein
MGLVDPNGLRGNGMWAYIMSFNVSGGQGGEGDIGWMTADQASAEQLAAAQDAAAQNSKSPGATSSQQSAQNSACGFWCGLGQRIKNGFTGHGFKTNEQLLPKGTVTTTETILEPNPSVTAATDVAGLVGAVSPKLSEKLHLGPAGAIVSMSNDPSPQNITINLVGLIPGVDVPVAINQAFIDAFDYKMHQDTPGHDKSNVIPTNVCDEGACMPNPDLAPCGGFCSQ